MLVVCSSTSIGTQHLVKIWHVFLQRQGILVRDRGLRKEGKVSGESPNDWVREPWRRRPATLIFRPANHLIEGVDWQRGETETDMWTSHISLPSRIMLTRLVRVCSICHPGAQFPRSQPFTFDKKKTKTKKLWNGSHAPSKGLSSSGKYPWTFHQLYKIYVWISR